MKICMYTETFLPKIGGQEIGLDALSRRMLDRGHEVTILAPMPRSPLKPQDEQFPYKVVRHPRFYSTHLFTSWYSRYVRKLWRRQRFDVMHLHSVYPCAYVASLCRDEVRAPMLIVSHGACADTSTRRFKRTKDRHEHAIRNVDALVSIGDFIDKGYCAAGANPNSIRHIPNGVETEVFAADTTRPLDLPREFQPGQYILYLGRLERRKGVDVLLEAYARLPRETRLPLAIVGYGDEREALERQATELGLRDRVCFLGRRTGNDKVYLLQHALCAAMPTRSWEGLPLVALECFASGCAIVGTDAPGLGNLIQPGVNGFKVPMEDAQSLSEALHQAIRHPQLMRQMGDYALRQSKEYDWSNVAARFESLYIELISQRRLGYRSAG
ncbi:MAG TPA: glycosyltransferase family 4 protein [Pirellulales bacterium]